MHVTQVQHADGSLTSTKADGGPHSSAGFWQEVGTHILEHA